MRRRTPMGFAAGLAALTFATAAVAQPAPAKKPPIPAAKLFPFLDRYLKLPAGDRTLFVPAYLLKHNGAPATDVKVWLLSGGVPEVIPVGPNGRLERLPTLAQLASGKVQIDAVAGTKFSLSISCVATIKPATELSAADLAHAVRQADAGSHKAAGLLGVMLPKIDRAVFTGGAGGQAVMNDGSKVSLPGGAAPYANLALLASAASVTFTRAPSLIDLDGASRK